MNRREPATMLKSFPLLALVTLFSLSSCDKVRKLASQLEKKPRAAAAAPLSGSGVSEIPKGITELLPSNPSRILMVDYYADWCGPCRMLSPILEKIADENPGSVRICKVNVDKFREIATQENVKGIPDVRIYLDGKLVNQFVGALPEAEVRKRIEDLVRKLPPVADVPPKPKEPAIRPMTKDWMPQGIQRR